MSTEIVQQPRPLAVGNRGIAVNSMEDLWKLAQAVVRGGFAPRGMDTAEKCMAAMALGMELGIAPMASLRGIAVINGRPSVYGDLVVALVHNSGLLEYCKEWIAGDGDARTAHCEAQRVGRPDPVRRQFSVADAKRAGLWQKEGPWKNYPDRMLQMRARSYALRDEFADVLQGLYLAEEAQDIAPSEPVDARPRVESVLEKVKQNALPAPLPQPSMVEPLPPPAAPISTPDIPGDEAAGIAEAGSENQEQPEHPSTDGGALPQTITPTWLEDLAIMHKPTGLRFGEVKQQLKEFVKLRGAPGKTFEQQWTGMDRDKQEIVVNLIRSKEFPWRVNNQVATVGA